MALPSDGRRFRPLDGVEGQSCFMGERLSLAKGCLPAHQSNFEAESLAWSWASMVHRRFDKYSVKDSKRWSGKKTNIFSNTSQSKHIYDDDGPIQDNDGPIQDDDGPIHLLMDPFMIVIDCRKVHFDVQ